MGRDEAESRRSSSPSSIRSTAPTTSRPPCDKQKELFATDVRRQTISGTSTTRRFKALANWVKNVAEPFDLTLARGKDRTQALAASVWAKHRQSETSASPTLPASISSPRAVPTSTRTRCFPKSFWHLLQAGGRLGIILPTGIYSDLGTKTSRELFLSHGRLDLLYAFQNEKKIFACRSSRSKQVVLVATKRRHYRVVSRRFRMGVGDSPQAHEIPDDILGHGSRMASLDTERRRRVQPEDA